MIFFIRSLIISGFFTYCCWLFQWQLEKILLKDKKGDENDTEKGKAR